MKHKFTISSLLFLFLTSSVSSQQPDRGEVLSAMKKAANFMTEKVSIHGGYLWNVSEDFSKKYGEVPARDSQIWVQAGTPMVGMAYLDAFDVTKDKAYLDDDRKAAEAHDCGQNPVAGWTDA